MMPVAEKMVDEVFKAKAHCIEILVCSDGAKLLGRGTLGPRT